MTGVWFARGVLAFLFHELAISSAIRLTASSALCTRDRVQMALEISRTKFSSSSSPLGMYGLPQCSVVPKTSEIRAWSERPRPSRLTKTSGSKGVRASFTKTRSMTEKRPRLLVHVKIAVVKQLKAGAHNLLKHD